MAQFNTTAQSVNEMDDLKQLPCIWDPVNHPRINHSKYQTHQINCPRRPKIVYECQYISSHEFRTLEQKDTHELNCEGMKRILREEKERAEWKGKSIGAPVVVEKLQPGESTDEWADEGAKAGVKDFRAPGLGLSPQEIEDYIENFKGDQPVCEYMLVAMSHSQKARINDKQRICTLDRAAETKRLKANPPEPVAPVHAFRAPRNAAIGSMMLESSSQESGDGSPEKQEPRDKNNPWGKPSTGGASDSDWPTLGAKPDTPTEVKFVGIGRGRKVTQSTLPF